MTGCLGAQALKYFLFIYLAFFWFNHNQIFLDPALNVYFDLTIWGTDTVCIDWTLQVLLSFK